MSKATKRKYVAKEILDEFILPKDNQRIVKVSASRGNNLHLVKTDSGEEFLASMPTKFRKNIWIKRGDFVIVEPIKEGTKVKAEIVHILYKHNINYIKQEGCWPQAFLNEEKEDASTTRNCDKEVNLKDDSSSDDDCELFVNPNRGNPKIYVDSDEESSTNDEEQK